LRDAYHSLELTKMRQLFALLLGGLVFTSSSASTTDGIAAYNTGNYAVAFREFSAAANSGSAEGKHLLASLYYQGHGVERDLKRAVALFTEAAAANYPPSLANLALMYSNGDGVPKDMNVAVQYGIKAAQTGDVQSQFNLAQAYRKGAGVVQDYSKAAYWYRKAAEAGSQSAQNEYGLLFAQGHGVPRDYVQAYAWIDMPASAGDPQSIKNKAQLLQILDASQQKQAVKLAAEYAVKYGLKR
jgi:TPR repeat protein